MVCIVLFSPWAKRFFSCFLVHDTQHARRYITRYVWVSPHAGGACTGRRKALGRAGKHFRTTNASIELQNQTAGRGVFFCFCSRVQTFTLHAAELCMFIRRPHSNTAMHIQAYNKDKAVVVQQQYNKVTRATTANKKKSSDVGMLIVEMSRFSAFFYRFVGCVQKRTFSSVTDSTVCSRTISSCTDMDAFI